MKFSAAIAALFMASEAAAFVPAASRAAVPSIRYSAVAEPENAEKAKVPAGLEKEIEGMKEEVAANFEEKAEVKAFVPPPGTPSITDWDRIEP